MKAQIKIPAVGESITEATISQWQKKDGDHVKRDEILLVLETDKASVEVVSEYEGQLKINVKEGQTVAIGAVVGEVDTDAAGATTSAPPPPTTSSMPPSLSGTPAAKPSAPPKPVAPPTPTPSSGPSTPPPTKGTTLGKSQAMSPAVRRIIEEQSLHVTGLQGTGKDGRLTKGDLLGAQSLSSPTQAFTSPALNLPANVPTPAPTEKPAPPVAKSSTPLPQPKTSAGGPATKREPMTKLRQTIARRLVEAQHTAAILTTFNEIDMTNVMALRAKYKDRFKERYNIGLGFMGFFVKAAIEALKAFPKVNAFIEGTDIVYNQFYNVGIAVGTERGLLVPVIRNADLLSISEVELSIKHYAEKARDNKIAIDDLTSGTFTISNGGVYGSLMSTPILNPPQSGILGLHKIEERPMAIAGKVEIRSMMYVALSYDHRIVDGGESVSFLVKIKEGIEDPSRLLLEI